MPDRQTVSGLLVEHAAPMPGSAMAGRPPLLLVHGAGHGAWCWELWMEALPRLGWEAYALSLRGHPGSHDVALDTFCRGLRVEDYADDVATVARHIGRPCVPVGHSMGGIVCQRFAASHLAGGGTLAALVLLAGIGPGQLGPLRPAALPEDKPYGLERDVARARYFHATAPDVLERALARISPESPHVMNQYSLGVGVPIAPEEIACPLLSVTSGYDGSSAPRDDRIARYYGGQWLHAGQDGHDLMLEVGWERLLRRILAWLDVRVKRT